jgi:hypothetical protein
MTKFVREKPRVMSILLRLQCVSQKLLMNFLAGTDERRRDRSEYSLNARSANTKRIVKRCAKGRKKIVCDKGMGKEAHATCDRQCVKHLTSAIDL